MIGAGLVPAESLPDSVFAEEMNATVPPLSAAAGPPGPIQQPSPVQQQTMVQPPQSSGGGNNYQQPNFGGPSSLMNGIYDFIAGLQLRL